ncbi:MAG: hypothetical protein AVDCRST_MAG91-951, partial [uncultured Sphingomonadaceae bacterium]
GRRRGHRFGQRGQDRGRARRRGGKRGAALLPIGRRHGEDGGLGQSVSGARANSRARRTGRGSGGQGGAAEEGVAGCGQAGCGRASDSAERPRL